MTRQEIKTLIELSTSYEEADFIIERYAQLPSNKIYCRIAFLMGMFNNRIVFREVEDIQADYVALLTSIVENKMR